MIRSPSDISPNWLSRVLGKPVSIVDIHPGTGNWSNQWLLDVQLQDEEPCTLRLKLCLGNTFGRSEVDYYTTDYVDMPGAPLVRCFDAQHEEDVGYHLLLEDLSSTHHDRRDIQPTLAYGKAAASALGRMHRQHWQSRPAPDQKALIRYLDEARPGLAPLQSATGHMLDDFIKRHEAQFLRRWSSPKGMTLLHGDLNPSNVLTPKGEDSPVYFLDRQPFDWSLTYGVAVHDLAYFLVLWWPPEMLRDCEEELLRHWYESVAMPDYSWSEAKSDWALSVEQCMNVPLEWCSKPHTFESMRPHWEAQLACVMDGMARLEKQKSP